MSASAGSLVDLVLERPVVLAVQEPFGVQANQLSAVAHVVEPLSFHGGGGADALLGEVVFRSGSQFVRDGLPQELAIGLPEAHEHAPVALDIGVPGIPIVGAEEDLPIGHHRVSI